jgi:hypothetical protein
MKFLPAGFLVFMTILFASLANCVDEKSLSVQTWDLAADPDYAARTIKQLTTLGLESPNVIFLDNQIITSLMPMEEGRAILTASTEGRRFVPRISSTP